MGLGQTASPDVAFQRFVDGKMKGNQILRAFYSLRHGGLGGALGLVFKQ